MLQSLRETIERQLADLGREKAQKLAECLLIERQERKWQELLTCVREAETHGTSQVIPVQ